MSVKRAKRMLLLLMVVLVSTSIILLDTITSKTQAVSVVSAEVGRGFSGDTANKSTTIDLQLQEGDRIAQRMERQLTRPISEGDTRKIRAIIRNALNREFNRESAIHLNITSTEANKKKIRLNYAKGCYGGTACRLGMITGEKLTRAPRKMRGSEVSLRRGITGYFVDSTCGANCSDATISWDRNGRRYTLGLKASKKETLVKMANELTENELSELAQSMPEIPLKKGFIREEMGSIETVANGTMGRETLSKLGNVEEYLTNNKQRGYRYLNRIIESIPEYLGLREYAWDSIPLILRECYRSGVTDRGQIAYILATAEHESGLGKWMEELASGWAYEGRSDLGNNQPGDGPRYKGRGFVQITGRRNYTDWSDRLGIDLVNFPEQAGQPDIAAKILVRGMLSGTFTGHRLGQYIWGYWRDFYNARRIVNGLDRAAWIEAIALEYYKVL